MLDETSAALDGATAQLRKARDHLVVGVADAVQSGVGAAKAAKEKLGDGVDSLIDQGKDLVEDGGDIIRDRPWASVGVALAVGYIIAKLTSRN
jgi:ElaB/YqjD/DUF883 family membrane-anchored ribosome-binding protein